MGFFWEIKALMVNLIHENKNFLKGSFSRNSQLRLKEKIYKSNGSPCGKGNPNQQNKNQEPLHKTHKPKILFIL